MKKTKRFSPNFLLSKVFKYTLMVYILSSCNTQKSIEVSSELYDGFVSPPAEARPFVRWWWNGNKVNAPELERELEVLKKAGFGGVEINPIALPKGAPDNGDKELVWMSDEWIDMLVLACKKSKDLDMIADLIVGTGWPFGGEFLKQHETSQRMVTHYIPYGEGATVEVDESMLLSLYLENPKNKSAHAHESENTTYKLHYVKLVPEKCSDPNQTIDLLKYRDKNGKISYKIEKPGKYNLCYGILQQNSREVYLGAPGGAGPVMDHYKKDVTYAYLSRLKEVSERTNIPLSDLLRALFCDSIEISGANWTDNFAQLFYETYGYKLDDWLPFVFYNAAGGYLNEGYDKGFSAQFKDQLKRVRFDYNNLLVQSFLTNFTQVFKDFCSENDLQCRYQAYGTPFLMGMLDGYTIPDIPESNNWIYSAEMKDSKWQWNQPHGYMIWNMFTAAGGHLKGRKIISCESMTNTKGVFRTTLEEIKQHDDMNFITGMNHAVLHGFNYSPTDVAFPGWIRYGSFFSELNPWWKHINRWVDYNARLSFILQNSQPDKSIAVVGPTYDLWGDEGLGRTSFHIKPEYLYKLWEPISQLGYSTEYINQKVLEDAQYKDGSIIYGNMKYDLLVLASIKSITPKAAGAVKRFVETGGKVVLIDGLPTQSPGYVDYKENDGFVLQTMEELLTSNPKSFIQLTSPASLDELFTWTKNMLDKSQLAPDVTIDNPSENVYQIHQYTQDKEIYFFTNINRNETYSFEAQFQLDGKYPWVWNPETGERTPFQNTKTASNLTITLEPLQSLLLVFEDEPYKTKAIGTPEVEKDSEEINTIWNVTGKRVDGQKFSWSMSDLSDFSQSEDETQSTFGGELIYKASINDTEGFTHIDLGDVNEGITELYVNGKQAGTKWYGKATYSLADYLKEGNNEIEIRYATVLANYCISLKDNPVAQTWTKHKAITPTGIVGPVRLLSYQ